MTNPPHPEERREARLEGRKTAGQATFDDSRPFRRRVADDLAQAPEGLDVVDVLMAVQLEAELFYAEPVRIGDEIAPIGDQHLVPLIGEDLLHLGRPVGDHPIGIGVAPPARTARHHDDALDPHQAGELDGLARHRIVAPPVLAGMERIARAVERADLDAVVAHPADEILARGLALDERVKLQMRRRRPVAAGEFQHLDAELGGGADERGEIETAETVGDHADLHVVLTGSKRPDLLEASAASASSMARRPSSAPGTGWRPSAIEATKLRSSAA